MCYIKSLLIILCMVGLSGTVAGAGTADLLVIIPSFVLMVSCAVGACIAEEMEETLNDLSTQRLPIPARVKAKR